LGENIKPRKKTLRLEFIKEILSPAFMKETARLELNGDNTTIRICEGNINIKTSIHERNSKTRIR